VKIKPTTIKAESGKHIPAPRLAEDAEIQFSFKLLDLHSNAKFGVHHCEDGYLGKMLLRFQDVNRMRVSEFRGLPTKQPRNHKIEFVKTSEPTGFATLNGQLQAAEPWQFQLTKTEHGRVHGILIGTIFFVIWIDPCHQLYAASGKCGH
jgi:hypothetical protein